MATERKYIVERYDTAVAEAVRLGSQGYRVAPLGVKLTGIVMHITLERDVGFGETEKVDTKVESTEVEKTEQAPEDVVEKEKPKTASRAKTTKTK